jgi:hypothetical protein
MAILEGPLYADEADGSIRHTVTFFQRGEWATIAGFQYHKDPSTPAQLAQRQLFLDAVSAWRSLPLAEKLDWAAGAVWPQTGFNAFMRYTMSPPDCPTQWFEEIPWAFPAEPRLLFSFTNPLREPTAFLDDVMPNFTEIVPPQPTLTFTYSIP